MVHLAPPAVPRAHPAERALGVLLVVLGLALAALAYTALGQPGGRQASRTLLHPVATPPAGVPGTAAAAAPPSAGSPPDATTQPGTDGTGTGAGATGSASNQAAGNQPAGPESTALVVLDNTGRPELARSASIRFSQGGWTVTDTSTFEGDILSTAAYYDPAIPGAQAAAEALQRQFPEIRRVRPKFVGLGSGPVIVVLTFDYSQEPTTS